MAAPESPTRTKGRPPDTPIFGRKLVLSKNYARYSYVTKSVPNNPFLSGRNEESYIGFNELLEDNIRLVQDVNKNNLAESPTKMSNKPDKCLPKSDKNLLKHGFPKILCLKKNSICNSDGRSALKTLNVNSLENLNTNNTEKKGDRSASKTSLEIKNESTTTTTKSKQETEYSNNYYSEKSKNRNSFHQNVEEALSSLLWQPYEYQNQNNNEYSIASNGNENYDYESYSTCSYTPSTSPISLDLDETTFDNSAAPSSPSNNTKKQPAVVPSSTFLQCTAASMVVPPLHRRDLHSDVINLNRQEPRSQSEQVFAARDVLLRRSGTGAFVSLPSLASLLLESEYGSVPHADSVTSCSGEFSGDSSMHSGQQSTPANALSSSSSDNGLKSAPIKVDLSLDAANIVGLPSSHARYASVPCSSAANFQNAHTAVTRSQQNVGYPQHFRNVSEPSQQFLRYPNTSNNGQAVPLVHQKPHSSTGASSQIDQHNLQLINHFRSSSVPKSMTLVPKYDVTTSSGPPSSLRIKGNQVLQPNSYNGSSSVKVATNKPTNAVPIHQNLATPATLQNCGNISNVNVNFYRAVPVNVVSSVPTIHCLNTLSNDQGNSVSNVQVLPLGNGNHQSGQNLPFSIANSVTNVENQKVFDSQVTVQHNINAIRIDGGTYGNQMITSIIGYPEQGFKNVVSSGTNTGNGSVRGNTGIPVSFVNGLARNILMQTASTNFSTPAIPTKANSVVNVHSASAFATEVPYHLAGRTITTTAQINSTPIDPPGSSNVAAAQHQPAPPSGTSVIRTRTFTSTEAQTDEILPVAQSVTTQNQIASVRGQRRRERKERRQNRRSHIHNSTSRTTNDSSTQAGSGTIQNQTPPNNNSTQENRLPDILNSHLPPPYSTLPSTQTASMVPPLPPQILPPPPPPLIPGAILPNPPGPPVLQTVVPNGVHASAFVFPAPQQMAPLMQGGAPVPVAVPATAATGFRFGFPATGFRR